jgi:hypothetical protein
MATGACDLSCFPVDTFLELLSRNGSTQCMLLYKFDIGMAAFAGFINVGNIRHRSRVFTGQDIVFPMAIKTIRCPLGSFHDHLRVKSLLIFFLCFIVAALAIHPPVGSLLSTLSMGIICYFSMAVRAGELSVNGVLEACFRYKKGDLSSSGILL